VNYNYTGEFEASLQEAREAVRLSPTNASSLGNLVEAFMRLGRVDEAKQTLEETLGKNPDRAVYHDYSFSIAFLRGDEATMKRDLDWFAGRSTQPQFFDLQAGVAFTRGQFKKALELSAKSTDLLMGQDRKENASQNEASSSFAQATVGQCAEAKQRAAHAISLSRGKVDLSVAAIAFASCGDTAQAQFLSDELLKRFPQETLSNGVMVPLVRGAIENNRGRYAQALEAIEPAVRFRLGAIAGFWVNYLRGEAYLGQRAGKEAAAEYQDILDHRTAEVFSPLYALAHLGLARAAALSGDTGKSRTEYQNFFAAWKDADADLPILIQAKKEYEQLK
jgi:eukaryotic-like serine/threonine-protein kinase